MAAVPAGTGAGAGFPAGAAPAVASTWVAKPELMKAAVELLRSTKTKKSEARALVTQQIVESGKNPEFNQYLVYMLSRGEGQLEIETRQLAGLLLKQNVHAFTTWPPAVRAMIQSEILRAIGDKDRHIRRTVANVVTHIVEQVRLRGWPYLLQVLAGMLAVGVADESIDGALRTCAVLCEDWSDDLNSEELGWPLNTLIPKFILFFKHPNAVFRRLALSCCLNFVFEAPAALMVNMSAYLAGLSTMTKDADPGVRKLVCESLVSLTEERLDLLMPHIGFIIAFMLHCMTDKDDRVQLAACEFWTSFADNSDTHQNILIEHFGTLIPGLISCMVYSEEELADLPVEDVADAAVKDRDEDLAPYVYKSHAKGMDDDSDDEGDGDGGGAWTLRKCAGYTMDRLSQIYRNHLLTGLLPHLNKRFSAVGDEDGVWQAREAGIMAFGAVVRNCLTELEPCLKQLFPFLIRLLDDRRPLVRSITCWAVSRIMPWVVAQADQKTYTNALLGKVCAHMLDHNKKVQEAACSAFSILMECARDRVAAFINPILDTIVLCFAKYQRKNVFILYDAVGTMCDSLGPAVLNKPAIVTKLLTPLYKKWNAVNDDDRHLCVLLECMASVARGIGPAFVASTPPIFKRCLTVLESNLIALRAAEDAAEDLSGQADELRDFIVLSLDMFSALCEALGALIDPMVAASKLLMLVHECLKDENDAVRQSACAVIGDMAKSVCPRLVPVLKEVLGALVLNLRADDQDQEWVCNNASWAIGEMAVRLTSQMKPYAVIIVQRLVPLMNDSHVGPQLQANVAITIGRMALACPVEVAPLTEQFAANWIVALRHIHDPTEKAHAFQGLYEILKLNATAIAPHFDHLCDAIMSWQRPSPEMALSFKQIVAAFRTSFGPQWPAVVGALHPDVKRFMATHYGL